MAKELININVDNKELGQYLEALFEDTTKALNEVAKQLNKAKTADLVVPKDFFASTEKLSTALGQLSGKDFDIDMPDFSELQASLDSLSKSLAGFKFPTEVSLKKMPEMKAPEVNVDMKSVTSEIVRLRKLLSETSLSTEITNLAELPVALSQSQAKNLAEATPIVHNLTLTDADTWYNKNITAPTKGFIMQCSDESEVEVRFANTGPFWTIKDGSALDIGGYANTVYARSSSAGAVLQIIEIH